MSKHSKTGEIKHKSNWLAIAEIFQEKQNEKLGKSIFRGGHTGLILEIPYGTLESGGWLCVEKVRKKFGYLPFEEK